METPKKMQTIEFDTERVDIELLDIEDLKDLEKVIYDKALEIPFGNSCFQTLNFIMNDNITDGRKLRALTLQAWNTLDALKTNTIGVKKIKNEIERLEYRLNSYKNREGADYNSDCSECFNKFDKVDLELQIEEKKIGIVKLDKLVKDSLLELSYMYHLIKKFKDYKREDFENEEKTFYVNNAIMEIKGLTGPVKTMLNMGFDVNQITALATQDLQSLPNK